MADLRFAAAVSLASAASRNLRTAVLREDLTALLRRRARSFCLLRLICDLIFATRKPRSSLGRSDDAGSGLPTGSARPRRKRIAEPAALLKPHGRAGHEP